MDPHRLFHEALPSKLNLIRRKPPINPLNLHCQEEILSLSITAFSGVKNWEDLRRSAGVWSLLKDRRHYSMPNSKVPKELFELINVILWNIWYQRNLQFHGEGSHNLVALLDSPISFVQEFHAASSASVVHINPSLRPNQNRWSRPPPGCFKVNVDAAIWSFPHWLGAGGVIRDCYRAVVAYWSLHVVTCFSPEVGELIALREGFRMAGCLLGLQYFILQSQIPS
ncbi:LOW QUALITY PROTEIN: hypothetical protein TorRG33x02_080490 [Trema orientale]|uniref:RNase H type-1 domain-containing protein n=1 Tax=Trema orientale TaxID=63057 RepID=A0A2P5FEC1_TREOI|nr:LOW QUALITY PROTEIN: hypothetical protein TorRG33x02_080490 [Trema orientale]